MNVVKSQLDALMAARMALSRQEYDLKNEIVRLMDIADKGGDDWISSSIERKKIELAEAVVQREVLTSIMYTGLKETESKND